ncbi:MAG: Fic family protein [Nitrospira sp.]|nr:Fic family protein [Nitrospira sp.]MDH4244560.1 Fic family protein [Nitrospira sp.]MDH4357279.1 Fic family protein [Nitrospira sp.]MDH5319502.1 Fic family protein [Nitrospira sp.]
MTWNWQEDDWPNFTYDREALAPNETQFIHEAGMVHGAIKHLTECDKSQLAIELISNEAVTTSEIEGELLNRDSVQSSIRRNFGLDTDNRKVPPAEAGIAALMSDLYQHASVALSEEQLFRWHAMLMRGRKDLTTIGAYRTTENPMQVVSGPIATPKVHFEAPPSDKIPTEMNRFLTWFNHTAPDGQQPLPTLTRAGIAHLYFESIHPFEDGNGRIGRALSEKALSQSLGRPTLIALSQTICRNRKAYYTALEDNSKDLNITDWLLYFTRTVLEAQQYTQRLIDFLIAKTRLYDRLRGKINERQDKALARMFREGLDGFKGGLSAENYLKITNTSRATATRDLQSLVELGAFRKTGELKHTRYWLSILTEPEKQS